MSAQKDNSRNFRPIPDRQAPVCRTASVPEDDGRYVSLTNSEWDQIRNSPVEPSAAVLERFLKRQSK